MSSILKIDPVTLLVWLSEDRYSGAADTVSLQIGMSKPVTIFHNAWSDGRTAVSVDVQVLFVKPNVPLGDLSRITVIQKPADHPLMSDDFQIGGRLLSLLSRQSHELTKL